MNNDQITLNYLYKDVPLEIAQRLKIRLAIGILMQDSIQLLLTDDLAVSLAMFRDTLDVFDMMSLQGHDPDAGIFSEVLADILRSQIARGILRPGMTLTLKSIEATYDVPAGIATSALHVLAGENLLTIDPVNGNFAVTVGAAGKLNVTT